jgi:hypothetical protein
VADALILRMNTTGAAGGTGADASAQARAAAPRAPRAPRDRFLRYTTKHGVPPADAAAFVDALADNARLDTVLLATEDAGAVFVVLLTVQAPAAGAV